LPPEYTVEVKDPSKPLEEVKGAIAVAPTIAVKLVRPLADRPTEIEASLVIAEQIKPTATIAIIFLRFFIFFFPFFYYCFKARRSKVEMSNLLVFDFLTSEVLRLSHNRTSLLAIGT
jgi:hypothetical protein